MHDEKLSTKAQQKIIVGKRLLSQADTDVKLA